MSSAQGQHTNRLVHETSPYLLQHAHNPVDWYPWGPEALERSRSENRPILLSIGYSSCHWCHVMERESFEDEEIGRFMSDHFVCIKVDREERPDLDEIYMAATMALNRGQGGWPMTVFLTPDQQPFFAGTYFPPEDRWGRPGFLSLLRSVADSWQRDRDRILEQSRQITDHLRHQSSVDPDRTVAADLVEKAVSQLASRFDDVHGGFGPAPKFPPSTTLRLLLRHHLRTGDRHSLFMVWRTLEGMAHGGMYDQIGGGFARYSTDQEWLVPHFEKMLYDNALLVRAYLEAFQVTGDALHRRIALEVLEYVRREMTAPEGGFFSATDADSEGVEGKFFVWTPAEIEQILDPPTAELFCAVYDITPAGNWEGKSIPRLVRPIEDVARERGLEIDILQATLDDARARVYRVRLGRVPPGLDDKILTAWNALMIGAMAEGSLVLEEPAFLETARNAAGFLLERLRRDDGRLLRTYRAGKAHLDAYLEDYAYLVEALVDLHEASGEERWIREAGDLAGRMIEEFGSEDGAFYSTSRRHETLIMRHREGTDGATPNPNATAALALARLAHHLDRPGYRAVAVRSLQAYGKTLDRHPLAFAKSLIAVDFLLEPPLEIVLVGAPDDPRTGELRRVVGRSLLPGRVLAMVDPRRPAGGEGRPLVRGKGAVDEGPAAYLCEDFACRQPITGAEELARALEDRRRSVRRETSIGAPPADGSPAGA